MSSTRRTATTALALTTLAGLLAACSTAEAEEPTTGSSAAATTAAASSTLADACGADLDVQLPWWPGVDYAFLFQLTGAGGEIDADNNTYTGQIGDTGVQLTLRAGGPASGFQQPQALLYQDDSIDLAVTSAGDQVGFADSHPTVSVFSYYDTYPVILLWGTDEWDFQSVADIQETDATILAYGSAAYLPALESTGVLNPDQVDASFDGSPARFVAEQGRIVQQDYITSAPYNFEHVIDAWGKPISFLSIHEEFPIYGTTLQVRSDRFEELSPCLTELVPLIQQASVDYALDPSGANEALIELSDELDGIAVKLTPELLAASNAAQLKYGIVQNGTDGVLGSFDVDRVQQNIDLLTPGYRAAGLVVPDGLAPADIVTNEFLDTSISLPADVPVPANSLPDDVAGLGR